MNQRRSIEVIAPRSIRIIVHIPDEQAGFTDRARQFVERAKVVLHKPAFREQVTRWIAGNRQFRCEH